MSAVGRSASTTPSRSDGDERHAEWLWRRVDKRCADEVAGGRLHAHYFPRLPYEDCDRRHQPRNDDHAAKRARRIARSCARGFAPALIAIAADSPPG